MAQKKLEGQSSDDVSFDFTRITSVHKDKPWLIPMLLLLAILIYGYSLRAYHLDYPVVGYHNVKESHTLGEALNFYRGEPLLVPRQHYYTPDDATQGIIALGWKVFGLHLWVARLVIVLFSLGIIVLTYAAMKQLFGKEDVSLLAALLAAVTPLMVFFGRNVQYDTPSTFFTMAAIAAYLRWRKDSRPLWFALMCFFVALGAVSKWPAVFVVVPIMLTFPWSTLIKPSELKKYIGQYLLAIPAGLFAAWWYFYSATLNPEAAIDTGALSTFIFGHLGQFFTGGWWGTVYAYASTDNFSGIGVWLAVLGIALSLLFIKRFGYRFIFLWAASFLLYGLLFANFLSHHNYYQMPYAPLWAILVAVFLNFCVSLIPKIALGPLPGKSLRWAVLIAIFLVLRAPLKESVDRQFATQFYGLDVAGEYIKTHSAPGELIMDSGHQDRGVLWHSDRDLVSTANVSEMIALENERNLNWAFAYQWGFSQPGRLLTIPEIAEHIYSNYTLRQFGFLLVPGQNQQAQVQPMYFLYNRGGSSQPINEFLANLSRHVQEHPPQKRAYDDPFGRQIELYYITFD